jgi:hypothetical protein
LSPYEALFDDEHHVYPMSFVGGDVTMLLILNHPLRVGCPIGSLDLNHLDYIKAVMQLLSN